MLLAVRDESGKTCVLRLGRDLAINPAKYPHDELAEILGADAVRLE